MKKVYIAGAGGMLGEAFYQHFSSGYEVRCSDIDVNEEWLRFLDFRDLNAYRAELLEFRPDYLFHLGAHTSLEYCERHVSDAYSTNTMAVENAVYLANSLDIPLLYISTAGIFDGALELYDDWALPNPLGVYARSKYMGERFVVENARRYLVCRAGWMMGGGPRKDKKFVQKLMAQLKAGACQIRVVDDKDGTPTYTHDFALNVRSLLESECWGLYNMVCGGETSRFDVARELLRILGLQAAVELLPVNSSYFASEYFAPRPNSERLINAKLNLRGMNVMRDWRVALAEYVRDYYDGYLA